VLFHSDAHGISDSPRFHHTRWFSMDITVEDYKVLVSSESVKIDISCFDACFVTDISGSCSLLFCFDLEKTKSTKFCLQ
jgi:hypothetical protein